jgi:hypothetical protein
MTATALIGVSPALTHAARAQTWTPAVNTIPIAAAAMELLTDGTVMVQAYDAPQWYKLTPDKTGSYVNGTWTKMASMPSGYSPLYDASAVLPDGRLIVNGGEYNGGGNGVWTTKGAIYDPTKNAWTSVTPPKGWSTIGDAQSVVLPDGTYMLANCCTTQQAKLDVASMTWTATGNGKADINDEEGWTLLPSGQVLTVDANNTADLNHTEIYTNGTWASAGDTVEELPDLQSSGGGSHELGAAVLRPNGTVYATGATGHNGVYTISTGKWSSTPDFPVIGGNQYDVADGPATLEPSGNVLVAASPGIFGSPVQIFEFNGKKLSQVPNFPAAPSDSSFVVHFLQLPNGQIMETDFSSDVEFYTPAGKADKGSVPKITSIAKTLSPGKSYTITGVGLNGKSQGGGYGDDFQDATNYPIVRITNTATGDVFYANTTNASSYAVANPNPVTANVLIPKGIETGAATLEAIANGIPSKAMKVTIK